MSAMKAILALLAAAAVLAACHPGPPAGERAQGRALAFGGVSRSYLVYAPKARAPRPALLLVLHGWQGSAHEIEQRTRFGFDRLADRDGFVVAYPDAVAGQWHSGHYGEVATGDDVGFLSGLIDTLSRQYDVDPKRIYVTGFSNGASMTYRLACERSDRIAAIAPVSGGLAENVMPDCAQRSQRPIPLLLIHGTDDPVVAFNSGERAGNLAYWVRRNGCGLTPQVTRLPDADPNDGTQTRVESYPGCRDGADVTFYAIEGGGHHWPGGDEPAFREPHGRTPRDFDGATTVWSFLKAHPMP